MRNTLIILFLLFTFISCTSCSSGNSGNDSDHDFDHDSQDLQDEQDSQDIENDIIPDSDTNDTDTEKPDTDTDIYVPCLDLKDVENVKKTAFPFKDKNGKPTFCRPGCDTPTETDPQCVRNIWEWDNWEKYQEYLEAQKKDPEQEWERECYPWPCVLPDMKAYTGEGTNKCDRWLTVNDFKANGGAVWTHGMSEGVFGGDWEHTGRAIEYDPEKDQFTTVGHVKGHLNFNGGRYVLLASDSVPYDNPNYKAFVISVLRKDGEYYYELIYDNENHNAFMSNPSFAGKDWVLIQVRPGKESSSTDVKYAKAGDPSSPDGTADSWEWHSLGLGKVLEGNIVGNHLTFMVPYTSPDRQIYYCDLSKYPGSYKDCYKVTGTLESGEAEMGHSPRIDENDENRLIYYIYNKTGNLIKEVIFKDGEVSSTDSCQKNCVKG